MSIIENVFCQRVRVFLPYGKELLGIQSESLETLMGKAGLRYEQDHNARADARDLKRLLSLKHKGRTYLGRLLEGTQAKG